MNAGVDAISVEDVSKRYGAERALLGVSLALEAGSVCALLGANGAGKSTLCGILSTLVSPSGGRVRFLRAGSPVAPGAALRRQIGVLAHDTFVYGQLSGVENLTFYARLYGLDRAPTRVAARLDEVGLDERARARPAQTYSRGMLQRLALARALLHEPAVLLLDEPFAGLDRSGIAQLAEALRRAKEAGRLVLVVTHEVAALDGLCDHVVVLHRGKVALDRRAGGDDDTDTTGGGRPGAFSRQALEACAQEVAS
jgi:ABC-type multidrug transport system ATPase subunit